MAYVSNYLSLKRPVYLQNDLNVQYVCDKYVASVRCTILLYIKAVYSIRFFEISLDNTFAKAKTSFMAQALSNLQ